MFVREQDPSVCEEVPNGYEAHEAPNGCRYETCVFKNFYEKTTPLTRYPLRNPNEPTKFQRWLLSRPIFSDYVEAELNEAKLLKNEEELTMDVEEYTYRTINLKIDYKLMPAIYKFLVSSLVYFFREYHTDPVVFNRLVLINKKLNNRESIREHYTFLESVVHTAISKQHHYICSLTNAVSGRYLPLSDIVMNIGQQLSFIE
jgi:hypothetical protein